MTFASYRQIFARPDFRRFWLGFSISAIGDTLARVALTWYVYEQTGSAEALGLLLICYTGPIILGGLLAGWLLDRFDRRMVMLADNLVRGAAMAAIPLLHALGMLELWHLYVAAALYGLLMMIALAGGPTIVPSLVLPEQLATANALEMLSYTLAGVIGPVLAGVLISLIGAPGVVALDALSYLVFALLLLRMRPLDPGRASVAGARYTLCDAIRLLLSQPILSSTTVMFLIFNIGGGMLAVALPILVDRVIGGGPQLYGTLLGIQAGGEVLSAILAGSLTLRLSLGARICVAQALAGAVLLLVLTSQLWAVAVGLALFGLCSAPLTIWAQTLRMQVIPLELRGRSFALLRMLMQSGNPVGGALAGGLIPLLGSTILLAIAAALVGLPGVLGAAVPQLRRAGLVK